MGRGAPLKRAPGGVRRREWLVAAAGAPALALEGCANDEPAAPPARWVGAAHERGHRLRDGVHGRPAAASPASASATSAAVVRRVDVLIAGAGISGLGAARALHHAGVHDLALIELDDEAGGNSRGHEVGGIACPLGAHYLPLPGPHAHEVSALLEELGVARRAHGRWVYDERHLAHSPQERLWIAGAWHEGLLPPPDALPASERVTTLAQYRRFAQLVADAGAGDAFRVPSAGAPWTPALAALDAIPFAAWLDGQGLDAPALRWALDYACRDDYGADAAMVSAWAGLHYFASRHGFRAPDDLSGADDGTGDGEGGAVLTWPEGNAWLAQRMAAPFAAAVHGARIVLHVDEGRHEVAVDVLDVRAERVERWIARQVVLALPLFVALRLLASPSDALRDAAARLAHAPWLVANVHIPAPPVERPGAPPSWDNVAYGADDLGYVDAMHQSMRSHAGPTVFTAYRALGGATPATLAANRRALLERPAEAWARRVLADLGRMHPDLARRVTQVDLTRHGHAMAIPAPGVRGSAALRALAAPQRRLHFAHSDLAGYSVFEEALHHGARAGAAAARALRLR